MCYGGIDPKYMLRDTRAHVKDVAFGQDKSEVAGDVLPGGLWARLVALFRRKQVEGPGEWHPSRS